LLRRCAPRNDGDGRRVKIRVGLLKGEARLSVTANSLGDAAGVAIVGGGICGLTLALELHRRGVACTVHERAPQVKELGVGITVLPHGMREFTALGLGDKLLAKGIENKESCFFNRFGQLIYKEKRGKLAGYAFPEVGMHRGRLHKILYDAACERLGPEHVLTDRDCTGLDQDGEAVNLHFRETSTGRPLPPLSAKAAIACDGVNSAIRRSFYPNEELAFAGINTWRGVTRGKPILEGRSYLRIGSLMTGKIVIYPIIDDVDGAGNQLINWTTEIKSTSFAKNDWNEPGRLEDFIHLYEGFRFDWLDVPEMIRNADILLEYPMVDKDPVDRWSFGRVTLAGDAAHPMYPRGSNGSAQAVIDARVLADCLAGEPDPASAFAAYEAARRETTAKVVRANRENPPDLINIKVEELVGDRPFGNLDDYITQEELRALSDNYKRLAGFALTDVEGRDPAR
jgi:2-polyprenyl-6-methoxyphenol hydroxylase-like FAD-dependent oxidoreductase